MQQQQQEKPGEKARIGLGLLMCLGRPWLQLWTVPGTAGVRTVGNINFVWSVAILLLFAGLGRSQWLVYAAGVAALVQCEHWQKSKRSPDRHSFFVGESVIGRLVKSDRTGWVLTGLLAAGLGAFVIDEDKAAGLYLALSGLSMTAQFGLATAKSRALDDDLADGVLEAKLRAARARRQGG